MDLSDVCFNRQTRLDLFCDLVSALIFSLWNFFCQSIKFIQPCHYDCKSLPDLFTLFSFDNKLSTSIYDLVLIYVCHFHHHFHHLRVVQFQWNSVNLSRYSCLYLGSLHPRIFEKKLLNFSKHQFHEFFKYVFLLHNLIFPTRFMRFQITCAQRGSNSASFTITTWTLLSFSDEMGLWVDLFYFWSI